MTAPSGTARRLWEELHTCPSNERAWEIIERAFEEVEEEVVLRLVNQMGTVAAPSAWAEAKLKELEAKDYQRVNRWAKDEPFDDVEGAG